MRLSVLLLAAFASTSSQAQVSDGAPVNAATTNAAFLYKNSDDTALNRLTVNSGNVLSGTSITDIQREMNSLDSFLGKASNQVYNYLPVWTNNDVGASTDSVKLRADNLTQKFSVSGGHAHDGSPGGGAQLSFTSILGVATNSQTTGTASNAINTLVLRDGSGNFAAGTITAGLTGTASGNLVYTPNNHGMLVSSSSNTLTVVAPDSSTTKVWTSGGSSADPSWQVPAASAAVWANTSQSSVYPILTTDNVVDYDASGGGFTTTLPTAVGLNGHEFVLCKIDSTLNTVTINTTSAQTIGGYASGAVLLASKNDCYRLVSNNSNYIILGHTWDTGWSTPTTISVGSTSAFVFTVTSAHATAGDVYSNSGSLYIVETTINPGVSLTAGGMVAPGTSGTLTKVSGSGDATITFASRTTTGLPVKPNGGATVDQLSWKRNGTNVRARYLYLGPNTTTGAVSGAGDYLLGLPVPPDITRIIPTYGVQGQNLIGVAAIAPSFIFASGSCGQNGAAYGNVPHALLYPSTLNIIRAAIMYDFTANVNIDSTHFALAAANSTWAFEIEYPAANFTP